MARYYFLSSDRSIAPIAVDLACEEEARSEGLLCLANELRSQARKANPPETSHLNVTDSAGVVLFNLCCSIHSTASAQMNLRRR